MMEDGGDAVDHSRLIPSYTHKLTRSVSAISMFSGFPSACSTGTRSVCAATAAVALNGCLFTLCPDVIAAASADLPAPVPRTVCLCVSDGWSCRLVEQSGCER